MNIGFIGIGNMGQHMSRHILEAGYKLVVNDIKKEFAKSLLDKGAKWADSPREVAESCQLVISCLPGPSDVEKVVYGENGLLGGWKKGDIYIDMSTNSPTLMRRIAVDAKKKGVEVLDAPVSGGVPGAESGTLAIMVGGSPEATDKVKKILEAMGNKIFYVGDVGCGNIAKLVNNLISITCSAITAEGFVLGVKAGINPKKLQEVIKVSTGNNYTVQQYSNTAFKGNFNPGFKLSLALKDIGLAVSLGKELGLPLPVGSTVEMRLLEAKAKGLSDKHVDSTILLLEELAGVQVRSSE